MTERSLFAAALDIPDPAARAAFLDRACAADPALRRHLDELLAAQDRLGSFLARPVLAPTGDQEPSISEGEGTVIGPYTLREQIGEGGFGLVFVAEQSLPIRRKVALKVIKPGMDTRQVIARFEAERQALALMDHPNIAKVLDGGTTDSGRPYFVMELVRGIPITEYADANHLTPRDRLGLFVQVCHAVQHAHQKGVIHRDLKPSNILVAPHDGVPVVKVIDFGVAKALGQSLTDKTIYTRFAQMIGTPLYMSPEQAEVNQLDVDTRSDIYSLGVLLYELLTGTTPFDGDRFRKAAFDEIRRIIKEEDPPKPSARLSTSLTRATIAAVRQSDPDKLTRLVRGELDWIVMKALEKDRARRYESATGFAADVQRYLAGEPVLAVPPSLGYRLRKFGRRNSAAIVIVLTFFLSLKATTLFSLWQVKRATVAELIAETERDEADRARATAVEQRDAARRATEETQAWERVFNEQDLLSRTLEALPTAGRNVPVRELVDEAAGHLAAHPERDHRRGMLNHAQLAHLYKELGDLPAAFRHYAAAFDRYRAWRGEDHPETWGFGAFVIQGAIALADRHPADESPLHLADRLLLDWLAYLRRKQVPSTSDGVASVQAQRGYVLLRLGRHREAEGLLRDALPHVEPGWGAEILLPGPQRVSYWLGRAILARRDHAAAEPHFLGWVKWLQTKRGERALSDLREALPRLADLYDDWGKPAEAARWRAEWASLPPPLERGPPPREVK
jgi:serine/threonine protein kinase